MLNFIIQWIVVFPLLFGTSCTNCAVNVGPNRAVKQIWLPYVSNGTENVNAAGGWQARGN